ncbi:multidrug efflux RND transporter permease subunit [Lichenibacterium minor]|uniref:Multidrug efflux RND transporter permease subunit n=1 Tax=Lichenibacterium minor TaxID=2316528 RepID=A0A4Q2UD46_9HYPH|nr:multidrug efflux RND transporter permease subunit [Lichenibacterium minor]RYC32996.1 multidrug efflux RND transporter permease subunit [Lichenibacterium minor]
MSGSTTSDAAPASGGISAPFIKHPIATTLLMLAVFCLGLVAYPLLPVAPLPQVDFPTIVVSASLPGGSPDTMASSVAQPLERQFAQIPGVSQLTSTSSLGSSSITIQFDLDRNIDGAANDVQAAINAANGQLPKNLPSPPTWRKVNPADSPIMLLSATSDILPLTVVDDNADTKIAQQISQIAGVSQVTIGGEQKPSIRIQIDPAKLVTKGLSLEDVRTVVSNTTVNAAKGNIDGERQSFTIFANDQLLDPKGWDNTIIAYRNGGPIRISDIGTAVPAAENMKSAAWANGRRGVFLIIFKQPGANVIDIVDKIKKELPRLEASIPAGIKIGIMSDRTQTIRASVDDVQFTLVLTIALVVMVIFVFLRSVWATLIPSITVPLALLGAVALMWVAGYSLDNLSLMALTISVGFVVDDAIVMLENIERHLEEGMSPFDAAMKGAGEIGFTILSISISLIAVLIPLLLMSGIVGRLFREFSITLAMTILMSAFVSLTLTPMMAAKFLKSHGHAGHGRLYMASERVFDAILRAYEVGLDLCLRWRFATLLVFFATVGVTAYLFMIIPKGFFPSQDTGLIIGQAEGAQDISFADMSRKLQQISDVVMKDPAVYSTGIATGGSGAINNARVFITLKPRDERDVTAQQIIARLRPQIGKIEGAALFMQAAQDIRVGGRASRTEFQYTLQDPNFDELNTWSPKLLEKLKGLPQLRDVATDQQSAGTTLTLTIDRDQAARYGITAQLIDDTLYDAFGQRQVTQYFTQVNSYHVILEILPQLQGKVDSLNKLYLHSPITGGDVPLSALARWTTEPTQPLSISHQGQFPAVTISFNLAPGTALSQATEAITRAQGELNLPGTIQGTFQGTAQAFQQSLSTVPLLIVAALVVVYIILGILYESFIHPLTILSTLPSAGVGALAILMMFGYDFSLIALIGVILLIGIVKKNGIMLVDFAIVAERDEGLTAEAAIRKAALLRFRPILMTTMAALLGGIPLMLGTGTGSEIRQPLGYAMVGGLIVSQVLTLFTTPVIYVYLDRISEWLGGGGLHHDAVPAGEPDLLPRGNPVPHREAAE